MMRDSNDPDAQRFGAWACKVTWEQLFDNRMQDRDHVIGVYNAHVEHVKATIAEVAAARVRSEARVAAAVRVPRRRRSRRALPAREHHRQIHGAPHAHGSEAHNLAASRLSCV